MWTAPERRGIGRWIAPALALTLGVVLAAVLAADGRTGTGLVTLGVLAGYAALLAYRRNEPALPFSEAFGTGHRARAHLKSAAMTGDVLVIAVVGALVVQALRGADVTPFAWLAALAGATYLLSALFSGEGA
ncbi:ABC transporter permease [Actinomadura parmotrematis]|uniref:ABC transporter permease n=1 Tax=Actinomadura parmotrematis TaxID=2864039 RepID=A0ABS7FSC5_9ACTN|nr:ABC transporter permease [Actinomadura parmotrematis]MBW8483298.1 ABC transporter permease [Actinomadura parmotrematis]